LTIDLRPLLPRRIRLRLWIEHRIDDVAIWLVDHRHDQLAILLWEAFRLW
jgi:hypothetical protein